MIHLNKDKINDIKNILLFFYEKIIMNPKIHIIVLIGSIIACGYYVYTYKPLKIEIEEFVSIPQKNLYIIDSGHGFDQKNDCKWKSAKDKDGCFYEYEFNKVVTDYLCTMLDNAGIFYLRTDSLSHIRDMSITARKNFVNKIKNILDSKNIISEKHTLVLFSIHANAAKNANASGLEVFTSIKKCKNYKDKEACEKNMHILATILSDNLKLAFPNKPFRNTSETEYKETSMAPQGEITLIDKTNCYAVLSENGFYTNPNEREEMKTDAYKIKVATAHYKTICMLENINP